MRSAMQAASSEVLISTLAELNSAGALNAIQLQPVSGQELQQQLSQLTVQANQPLGQQQISDQHELALRRQINETISQQVHNYVSQNQQQQQQQQQPAYQSTNQPASIAQDDNLLQKQSLNLQSLIQDTIKQTIGETTKQQQQVNQQQQNQPTNPAAAADPVQQLQQQVQQQQQQSNSNPEVLLIQQPSESHHGDNALGGDQQMQTIQLQVQPPAASQPQQSQSQEAKVPVLLINSGSGVPVAHEANVRFAADLQTISAALEAKQSNQQPQQQIIQAVQQQQQASASQQEQQVAQVQVAQKDQNNLLIQQSQKSGADQQAVTAQDEMKQIQAILNVNDDGQVNMGSTASAERDALISNATRAIEGLIEIKAQKLADAAAVQQQQQQAQQTQQLNNAQQAVQQQLSPQPQQIVQQQLSGSQAQPNSQQGIQDANQLAVVVAAYQNQNTDPKQTIPVASQPNAQTQPTNPTTVPMPMATPATAPIQTATQATSPTIQLTSQAGNSAAPIPSSSDPLNIQSEIRRQISETLQQQNVIEDHHKNEGSHSSTRTKILDYLSTSGKISALLLAITPLPTYLGVWNKPHKEQLQRVESVSFHYLLLTILNSSIWTSYAFKIQNIDLAIVSVVPLIITIFLVAIYLTVKPEPSYIKQFFGTILVMQVFNFDMVPIPLCGAVGTLTSISTNGVSMLALPDIIQTRDVGNINLPLTYVNLLNLFIWDSYAILKPDPFMTVSQFLGFSFNVVCLFFYYWAIGKINSQDTPGLWLIQRNLIKFFKIFAVQKTVKELQGIFWHDENTDFAKSYIRQYKDDISELERKYLDNDEEKSYEQHMQDMRMINQKLSNLEQKPEKEGQDNGDPSKRSVAATQAGSSQNNTKQMQPFDNDIENKNFYEQANFWDNENENFNQFNHEQLNFNENFNFDDTISMNSFNSSMNFAKLQSQINLKHQESNFSESTKYLKSKLNNMNHAGQFHMSKYEPQQQWNRKHVRFDEEHTLILDDNDQRGSGNRKARNNIPNPVQEASIEEEQSDRGNASINLEQAAEEPRSSVASLIQMMQPGDGHRNQVSDQRQGINEAPNAEMNVNISIEMDEVKGNLSHQYGSSLFQPPSGENEEDQQYLLVGNRSTETMGSHPSDPPSRANASSEGHNEHHQSNLAGVRQNQGSGNSLNTSDSASSGQNTTQASASKIFSPNVTADNVSEQEKQEISLHSLNNSKQ